MILSFSGAGVAADSDTSISVSSSAAEIEAEEAVTFSFVLNNPEGKAVEGIKFSVVASAGLIFQSAKISDRVLESFQYSNYTNDTFNAVVGDNVTDPTLVLLSVTYTVAEETPAGAFLPVGVDRAKDVLVFMTEQSGSSWNSVNLTCDVTQAYSGVMMKPCSGGQTEVPVIIEHPAGMTVMAGEEAVFTVSASGSNLSFRWQESQGGRWTDCTESGGQTATIRFTVSAKDLGKEFRCLVSNSGGTVISSAAPLMVVGARITEQPPTDIVVEEGDRAVFTVTAAGSGLTYQWEMSQDRGTTWTDCPEAGSNTDTLTLLPAASSSGRMYRCRITGSGLTVFSNSATLTVYISDGWHFLNGSWYYFKKEEPQTGWLKVKNVWYYLAPSGAMQTGWQRINSTWYYLAPSGAMQTGWQKLNNIWYYFASSGAMQTGWQRINGIWYYLAPSGAMQTGWQRINGIWYYLASSGAMQTGWQRINGTWYYLAPSGAMQTGWQQINRTWYYLASSGAMQTGWQKISNVWYYFAPSGAMQTGWQKINGTWYYFASSGAMQTGWQKINGTWYYFTASGAMVTGKQKINGKTYYFSSSGGWIP